MSNISDTDKPEVIGAADSLMAVFGFYRVKCVFCAHSIGREEAMLLCQKRQILVDRESQCQFFEREPGVEGE